MGARAKGGNMNAAYYSAGTLKFTALICAVFSWASLVSLSRSTRLDGLSPHIDTENIV
jgi:hypothetical protein